MSHDPKQKGASQPAILVVILVLVLAFVAWYLLTPEPEAPPAPEPEAPVITEPQPTIPPQPLPTEPVPEPEPEPDVPPEPEPVTQPEPEPLPPLENSDDFAKTELNAVADGMQMGDTVVDDNLIRRFSVFVDNLGSGEVMRKQGPFTALEDPFTAVELNGRYYLDPDSYRRFDRYANFLTQIDVDTLTSHFERAEPLMDEAYQELGYAPGDFRGAVKEAIDELLAAPEYDMPLELTSQSVNYQYADERIEALSDAQKMMIRMGPDNARKVKAVLRELRDAL